MEFPSHVKWNPFIRRIEGTPKVGGRLEVSIQPNAGKAMTFRPTVLVVIPYQEFRWRGRFLLPGIFDGEHYFQISQISQDSLRFMHGERFSGVLVPFAKSPLESGTRAGFLAMNEALKKRAEDVTTS